MREINIRIRDKQTKKLVCCYQNGITMTPDTGELYKSGMNVTSRFIKEQYIDCKGKNGVEIYEGDLLKITPDGDAAYSYLTEVKDKGAIEVKGHDFDCTLIEWCDWLSQDDLEVLGNIYENPELIKQTKELGG